MSPTIKLISFVKLVLARSLNADYMFIQLQKLFSCYLFGWFVHQSIQKNTKYVFQIYPRADLNSFKNVKNMKDKPGLSCAKHNLNSVDEVRCAGGVEGYYNFCSWIPAQLSPTCLELFYAWLALKAVRGAGAQSSTIQQFTFFHSDIFFYAMTYFSVHLTH